MTEDIKKLIEEARADTACRCSGGGVINPLTCAEHGDESSWQISRLADALEAEHQRVGEAVSMRNRAYRQRDEEREAKEGNLRALNAALAECDAERERADNIQAALDGFRGVARGDNEYLIGRAEKAEAERDTAVATGQKILADSLSLTNERDAFRAAPLNIRVNMWRYCLEYPDDIDGNRDPVDRIAEGWVYYMRINSRIKIGYTTNLRQRSRNYPPGTELLAVEPGDRHLEARRHAQFSRSLAQGREWFAESEDLVQHISALAEQYATPKNAMHNYSVHEGIKHV